MTLYTTVGLSILLHTCTMYDVICTAYAVIDTDGYLYCCLFNPCTYVCLFYTVVYISIDISVDDFLHILSILLYLLIYTIVSFIYTSINN